MCRLAELPLALPQMCCALPALEGGSAHLRSPLQACGAVKLKIYPPPGVTDHAFQSRSAVTHGVSARGACGQVLGGDRAALAAVWLLQRPSHVRKAAAHTGSLRRAGSYPQVVIVGSRTDSSTQQLAAAAHSVFVPYKVGHGLEHQAHTYMLYW